MTCINLLPRREQAREEKKREYYFMMALSAACAVIIVLGVHFIMSSRINNQVERNTFLNNEITVLDSKIKNINELKRIKKSLIARMGIIQELQSNRARIVKLFDDIVTVLPSDIHLYKIHRKKNAVIFDGYAASNTNISQMMRNIENSHTMGDPSLNEIKVQDKTGNRLNEFSLQSYLKDPYQIVQGAN